MKISHFLLISILAGFTLNTPASASLPLSTGFTDEDKNEWLWIDTFHKRVLLMRQGKPAKVFDGAAFGIGGIGQKQARGDKVTPRGLYRIGWDNPKSQYRHFFGLTYPSIQDANQAVINRRISVKAYQSIINAHQSGRVPPQDTALGGQVGIHGLGNKALAIHQSTNWTFGCIALTNQQIEELSHSLKVGTLVLIN